MIRQKLPTQSRDKASSWTGQLPTGCRKVLLMLLFACGFFAGCGKHEKAAPTETEPRATTNQPSVPPQVTDASKAKSLHNGGKSAERKQSEEPEGTERPTAAPTHVPSDALPTEPPSTTTAPTGSQEFQLPTIIEDAQPQLVLPNKPQDANQLRQQAQELSSELVTRYPQSADAQEVKARFHLLLGETDAARLAWEAALNISPDYPYALHGMGKVGLLHSDFASAAEYLQRARTAQPNSDEVVKDLSRALTKLGKISEAEDVLAEFVDRHPESTETLVLLGQAQLARRDFESAKGSFERALELYPGLPHAQQGLGTALIRLGDRERAKELLNSQRESRLDISKNRSPEEVLQDELIDYSTRFVFAAQVFLSHGNWQRATDTLYLAAACDDSNRTAWTLLLDIQKEAGNSTLALQIAAEMCKRNESNPSCHFTRGILQMQAAQFDAARVSLNRVLELAPSSPEGLEATVRLNIQTNHDLPTQLEYAQKLVQLRGRAGDYELLGQAYATNGDLLSAKTALAKAIELDPNNLNYQQAMTQLIRFLK